uniref:Secreted protein n=1 Tax=Fagus sylvatica TaxID=28930 RepID=A0A2N9HL62_FAGSY
MLSLFSLFSFSASSFCLCSLPSHPEPSQPPRATPIRFGRVASESFRARPAARSDSRTRVRAISSRRVSFNRISRGRRRWRPLSTLEQRSCEWSKKEYGAGKEEKRARRQNGGAASDILGIP